MTSDDSSAPITSVKESVDVEIHWLSSEEGGRANAVHTQKLCRPHFRVGSDGEYLGVQFLRGDPPVVQPGATGRATVQLVYVENGVDYSPLVEGVEFEVLEGARVVGRGRVLRRYSSAKTTDTP